MVLMPLLLPLLLLLLLLHLLLLLLLLLALPEDKVDHREQHHGMGAHEPGGGTAVGTPQQPTGN